VADFNLLEFGDDVVIGDEVHLSGHTVEGGVVKTAPLCLGNNVTIGAEASWRLASKPAMAARWAR
jgi:hypothetical protein